MIKAFNKRPIFLLSVLLLLLLTIFITRQASKSFNTFSPTIETKNIEVNKNIAYGDLEKQKLDLCTPKNTKGKLPGVILLHGGGGDKSDFILSCQELAKRGFVAASVNFREEPSPSVELSLEDIMLALSWLKEKEYVDEERVAAMGGSYGGLMASLLGTLEFDNKVDCVVNNFGPTDLTHESIKTSPLYNDAVDKFFGGQTLEENQNLYEDFSPFHQLTENDASDWLLTRSVNDKLIPKVQMTIMLNKLEGLGLNSGFIEYEGKGGAHANKLSRKEAEKLFYQRIDFIENCFDKNNSS